MNVSALFGTRTEWANGIQVNLRSSSSDAITAFQPNQRMSIDEAKQQLRNASAALADAFRKFTIETKPVYTSSTITTGGTLTALSTVKVVETQTGTTTTSNADAVAADVSTAAEGLNGAIASLRELAAETPLLRSEVENAVRDAIKSLSSAGAQGLSLQGKGTDMRLAVDRTKLASSLAQMHDEIAKSLDSFSDHIDGFAASRPPELSPREIARLQLGPTMATYAASQIPNTLRLLRPPKKAADAYRNQMVLQK